MTAFLITANQLGVLSVIFIIGYFLKKKNYLNDDAVRGLSFILLNVSTCATVFMSMQIEFSRERLAAGGLMILCYPLTMLVGYIIALAAVKILKISGDSKKVWLSGALMYNAFFIGAPVTRALYGEIVMFYISFGLLSWNFVAYATVPRIFAGKLEQGYASELKRVFKTPVIIICIFSFAAFALRITFPGVVLSAAEYLSNTTTPISMLVLGAFASGCSFREVFADKRVYIYSLLRLIIMPLAVMALFRLFVHDVNARSTLVLASAMPVATSVPVFAQMFGGCGGEGAKYSIVTTVLSLLSLPVISMLQAAV